MEVDMKEFNTCEEYVLAELEGKKAQVQKLTEVCKESPKVRKQKRAGWLFFYWILLFR